MITIDVSWNDKDGDFNHREYKNKDEVERAYSFLNNSGCTNIKVKFKKENKVSEFYKDFIVSTNAQRTPEWHRERAGLPSASNLGRFMDRTKKGEVSAKAKTYYRELSYERIFHIRFEKFQTKPMRDGVFFENFARQQYYKTIKDKAVPATSYISSYFVATPDDLVGEDGLAEYKVVGDESYMERLVNGICREHYLQMQGQLMATGRKWVDYVMVNLKTCSFIIERVYPDEETIKSIYDELHKDFLPEKIMTDSIKNFDSTEIEQYITQQQNVENVVAPQESNDGEILELPF